MPATAVAAAATSPAAGSAAGQVRRLSGLLLITRDDGLYRRDLATGKESRLVASPSGDFIAFPAWSPDGKRIAYVVSIPFKPNADWGDDLYLVDADGRNAKLLLKHDGAGARLESPSWLPDGSALLFGYLHLVFDQQGNLRDQLYEVRRLRLGDGAPTTVLRDAGEPQLCRDGAHFAYIGFDHSSNTWDAVGFAAVDGRESTKLAGVDAGLLTFYAPHPSPDCSLVLFAAVGTGPQATTNAGSPASPPGARLAFARAGRPGHGSPWDLWSVRTDGSGLRQLTMLGEDEPYPEWTADGAYILFVGTNALYAINADGSNVQKLAEGTVHGQISWRSG